MFGTGSRIGALHGFTLTGAQFETLAGAAAVPCADLPGHGATPSCRRCTDHDRRAWSWLATFASRSRSSATPRAAAWRSSPRSSTGPGRTTGPGVRISGNRGRRGPGAIGATRRSARGHIEAVGVDAFLDEWLAGPIAGTGHLATMLGDETALFVRSTPLRPRVGAARHRPGSATVRR